MEKLNLNQEKIDTKYINTSTVVHKQQLDMKPKVDITQNILMQTQRQVVKLIIYICMHTNIYTVNIDINKYIIIDIENGVIPTCYHIFNIDIYICIHIYIYIYSILFD